MNNVYLNTFLDRINRELSIDGTLMIGEYQRKIVSPLWDMIQEFRGEHYVEHHSAPLLLEVEDPSLFDMLTGDHSNTKNKKIGRIHVYSGVLFEANRKYNHIDKVIIRLDKEIKLKDATIPKGTIRLSRETMFPPHITEGNTVNYKHNYQNDNTLLRTLIPSEIFK